MPQSYKYNILYFQSKRISPKTKYSNFYTLSDIILIIQNITRMTNKLLHYTSVHK